jgi:hypothetical protein
MRLIRNETISNNSIFEGDMKSRHNIKEFKKTTYFYAGQIVALSLVHGGPAPSCFAEAVADYIVFGIEKASLTYVIYRILLSRLKCKR